ncbi:MAG: hypothetical protein ACHQHM_07970, partial [Thermoanaerobaculales bacterium]
PVPLDKLEANDPARIPSTSPPSPARWPPSYFRTKARGLTSHAAAFQRVQAEGAREGKVFWVGGLPQAYEGYRAKIAGAVARSILGQQGTFDDFKAWDAKNVPPLASDDPRGLRDWWNWALRHSR